MPKTNLSKVTKTTTMIEEGEITKDVKLSDITPEDTKIVDTKVKKEFDPRDGIACRSVVQGNLYMEGSKTQMMYSWLDYGDVTEIEYRDLVAAVRTKSKFVFNPWFIIEDEDFIAEFPTLDKFYREQFTTKDLKAILRLDEADMVASITALPKSAFESLKSIAAQQVASGVLDSVRKIKALDKIFGTDLNLIGGLD